jgi:RNA polymerase sigma-70 factor, ECF subfamily
MAAAHTVRVHASNGDDQESDASVVRRVRAGDVNAFGSLVARYHGRCMRFAARVLDERADADDAVQMTFVRAYSALGRYQEQSRFVAWLFSILAKECRAISNRERRRAKHVIADEEALNRAVAHETPDDESERLTHALGRLEPLIREAFLLRHVEEHSYKEMMLITGAGESALKMRVKRACDALRVLLEER